MGAKFLDVSITALALRMSVPSYMWQYSRVLPIILDMPQFIALAEGADKIASFAVEIKS